MAGKLPFAPQRRHLNQASAPPARRGDHGIVLITPSTPLIAPTIADIRAAAERIAPHAVVTPLLSSPALDAAAGGRVLLKAEVLQHTGSFKLQGALNRLLQLTPDERINGVVAYSSGNHAQAIADNATLLGLPWVVVMPKDAPPLKIERTRAVGADLVLSDRYTEDRVAIGGAIAKERGAMIVPPFQSPHIVAGQGTLALEALTQAAAMGAEVDALLVCCVGGGLTAGCALAAEAVSPRTRVHPCKPSVFDDTARSLELGHCGANAPGVRSICDSIVTETPGEITFSSNLPRVGHGLRVTDDEVLDAITFAVRKLKLVVEPGGAAALAALLSLACPTGRGAMRLVAFVTQVSVIDQILLHLRTRATREAHAGPRSPRRSGPPRARARHAPPPTPRQSAAHGPDAPPPRGDGRWARQSNEGVRSVRAATRRPRKTPSRRTPRRGGGRRSGRRAPGGPRGVSDRAVRSPDTRPTPIKFPILGPLNSYALSIALCVLLLVGTSRAAAIQL